MRGITSAGSGSKQFSCQFMYRFVSFDLANKPHDESMIVESWPQSTLSASPYRQGLGAHGAVSMGVETKYRYRTPVRGVEYAVALSLCVRVSSPVPTKSCSKSNVTTDVSRRIFYSLLLSHNFKDPFIFILKLK